MKSAVELVLDILECYLKHGPSLSFRDLCVKTKISQTKARDILSILEKRGYLKKNEAAGEYVLTEKLITLI